MLTIVPNFALVTEMFAGLLGLIALAISLVGTVIWIWMLVDCATKEPSEGNDKIIWILIILFTHIIGALIYLIVRRPKRIAQLGR